MWTPPQQSYRSQILTWSFLSRGLIPCCFKTSGRNPINYRYFGSTIFRDIYQNIQSLMDSTNCMDLLLDGPLGVGKSHILATIAYLLTAQGYRVIYLPDCRDLLRDSVRYLRHAMLLAWADDWDKTKQILQMKTQNHIEKFLASHEGDSSVFFVLGRFDALNEEKCGHRMNKTKFAEFLNACRCSFRSVHEGVGEVGAAVDGL